MSEPFTIAVLFIILGCSKELPFSPQKDTSGPYYESTTQLAVLGEGNGSVKIMTRNIYVGTDVDVLLSAESPEQIPILAAQAFQLFLATNFPERAIALVKEIAETKPQLVGLQEVSIIRIQSPGDAVIGGTTPATTVVMDYLEILMNTLNSFGLNYKVAGKIRNADVEVPMIVTQDPLAFDDVRLTDYDVILVRSDVEYSNVMAKNYSTNLVIPDFGIEVLRGFVAIDAKVGSKTYRFVNTHLEPFLQAVQIAQAHELVATMAGEKLPTIFAGDFNTEAPYGDTYKFIQSQGYVDLWPLKGNPGNETGYTSSHDPDLRNDEIKLSQRIDLLFVKNEILGHSAIGPVHAIVVGNELKDRTPSGLWPSDHAGVVAHVIIPTPVFLASR